MSTPAQTDDEIRTISARLYAADDAALFELVAEHPLDFGCRPIAPGVTKRAAVHPGTAVCARAARNCWTRAYASTCRPRRCST